MEIKCKKSQNICYHYKQKEIPKMQDPDRPIVPDGLAIPTENLYSSELK